MQVQTVPTQKRKVLSRKKVSKSSTCLLPALDEKLLTYKKDSSDGCCFYDQ